MVLCTCITTKLVSAVNFKLQAVDSYVKALSPTHSWTVFLSHGDFYVFVILNSKQTSGSVAFSN